jgi:hypothetical protein
VIGGDVTVLLHTPKRQHGETNNNQQQGNPHYNYKQNNTTITKQNTDL